MKKIIIIICVLCIIGIGAYIVYGSNLLKSETIIAQVKEITGNKIVLLLSDGSVVDNDSDFTWENGNRPDRSNMPEMPSDGSLPERPEGGERPRDDETIPKFPSDEINPGGGMFSGEEKSIKVRSSTTIKKDNLGSSVSASINDIEVGSIITVQIVFCQVKEITISNIAHRGNRTNNNIANQQI